MDISNKPDKIETYRPNETEGSGGWWSIQRSHNLTVINLSRNVLLGNSLSYLFSCWLFCRRLLTKQVAVRAVTLLQVHVFRSPLLPGSCCIPRCYRFQFTATRPVHVPCDLSGTSVSHYVGFDWHLIHCSPFCRCFRHSRFSVRRAVGLAEHTLILLTTR